MSEFTELTDDGDKMTCPMPADETVVEVRLRDGSIVRAWYSCNIMEAGDFDFLPVDDDDGEPKFEADSIADQVRMHSCPSCGLVIDRDWNAALNILQAVVGLP
jgi:hypothetical protein